MAADVYIKLNLSLLQRCFFKPMMPIGPTLFRASLYKRPIASLDSHVMILLDNLTVTASDS